MVTTPDHTAAALAAIERSRTIGGLSAAQLLMSEAQVHATLALAAALESSPKPPDLSLSERLMRSQRLTQEKNR